MNILLDTHVFLWFINDDPRLTDYLKDLIEDENNVSYRTYAATPHIESTVRYATLTHPTDRGFA